MTQTDKQINEHDLETPDSIQVRFGISYVESRPAEAVAALSMPMERFRNPFTGAPTIGPLAILVDAAAGIVNHYRRRPGQWTVSSELSMDVSLDGVGDNGRFALERYRVALRNHRRFAGTNVAARLPLGGG